MGLKNGFAEGLVLRSLDATKCLTLTRLFLDLSNPPHCGQGFVLNRSVQTIYLWKSTINVLPLRYY